MGTDPATINPNLLLDESYSVRLCRVANSLAMLGHSVVEDKLAAAIGLDATNNSAIDFWNISGIGQCCSGGMCQIRAEAGAAGYASSSSSEASPSIFLCSQCERKVCKVCSAGKGALLLSSYNSRELSNYNGALSQSGSVHGSPADVSSNRSMTLDGVICKLCCHEIILDALTLDYVRVLMSMRRSARANSAAQKALDHVIGFPSRDCITERSKGCDRQETLKTLRLLLKGEDSLAEFPFASLLYAVETAAGSAPLLSLLAPLDSGLPHSYWKAPPSASSVEFVIALGDLSDVSGVVLLVSPCGYSMSDAPIVQIWASNKIHKEERSYMGKWDVRSLLTSASELCGPEDFREANFTCKGNTVPRHVKFAFRNPVRCRIIWITIRLQKAGSSSLNFEKDFNLLSLDENPFAQLDRRASFGGAVESDPCLHAKRILVVGSAARKDLGLTSPQGSDQISLRSWLSEAPQLNRFKVPIETERLMDGDLVLEQYLLPSSPLLAGFRLDGFSAVRPRVTHSPPSDVNMGDTALTFLEDRHISPAVLYIQVSAFQEPHDMFVIAEYRLPVVRPGTAMYFDFPRRIQTHRISFRLLGDVAAFADDPAEQEDPYSRAGLPAAGLSLLNRIKLYHYADSYELGKWASLSAI